MNTSVAAIVISGARVFVARRCLGGPLGGLWEFPGGKVEAGEGEAAALTREFDEEFGAPLLPLEALGETTFENRGTVRRLAAWLCQFPGGGVEPPLELREHLETRWVGYADLEALSLADSDRKLLPFIKPHLSH